MLKRNSCYTRDNNLTKGEMGKIKDEILDYCERHGLSEPPEGVTLEEIIKENKEHQ